MYLEMDYDKLSEIFVNNLLVTNRGFNFFVDWKNVMDYEKFEIELNAMDVLIRKENIKEIFIELAKKMPTFIGTFPLLFALSKAEREKTWKGKYELLIANDDIASGENIKFCFDMEHLKSGITDEEIEHYYYFFERMGLKNLCTSMIEKSIEDYVIGSLVGIDTNGRKNRGGKAFEYACEPIINKICEKYNVELISQRKFKKLE